MIFNPTPIEGAFLVDVEKIEDERGFFGRAFCADAFRKMGIPFEVAQANVGFSRKKGTLRGLHYQKTPHEEAKLVRCIRGAVFDVIIDLRKESTSYGRWFGTELSAGSHRLFHVPRGTAHGYLSLADDSEIMYLVSEFYTPEAERGVRWNDPTFAIRWPISNPTLNERDASYPLAEARP